MSGGLDLFELFMGLAGGLAIFLFGMEQMSTGLKAVAGDRMKAVLAKLTTNRFMGVFTGAFVTAVIQSSSVTTVLVVGFISAGLMSLSQAIGVIMGANIGTTITAQIIAFKVTHYALLMIAVGFAMLFAGKHERLKQWGAMLMGLGLVFFGMGLMSETMRPLRDHQAFLDIMVQMENPALGILVGAGFTALVQSSSATTGIVIVLASQGLITLPAGIAIAFGANIGTCVTAMLACIGKPREALRAALVHVIFNVGGVLIWIALIPQLAIWVVAMSPVHPELDGVARLAAETPRQIANAHTVFNVVNTLIFIWFTGPIARIVYKILPETAEAGPRVIKPRYINDALISTPAMALSAARMEIERIGNRTRRMMQDILPAVMAGTRDDLAEVEKMDEEVDALHHAIIDYLRKVGGQSLTEDQSRELVALMEIANYFENIGDIIETDLVTLGKRRITEGVTVSAVTAEVIRDFHVAVSEGLDIALIAAIQRDPVAAESVRALKPRIKKLARAAQRHGAGRLVSQDSDRLAAYNREMEMIENLNRVYYFAKRIARTVSEQNDPAEALAAE